MDTARWDPEAASLFHKAESLSMPLVHSGKCDGAANLLAGRTAAELFPGARSPEGILAGLLLRLNCWEKAHQVAQDLSSAEGSHWHAIVHRMEPDAGNAAYWFRRVGRHAIFPDLLKRSKELARSLPGVRFAKSSLWNPEEFLAFCSHAASQPGSDDERLARDVQEAEWQLLMEWCGMATANQSHA